MTTHPQIIQDTYQDLDVDDGGSEREPDVESQERVPIAVPSAVPKAVPKAVPNAASNVARLTRPLSREKSADGLWTAWTTDPKLVKSIVNIVRPAVVDDVRAMSKGRVVWRNIATASETLGRVSMASSTVLAFASASEVADQYASRILGFVAGAVGTPGMVLGGLANFARTQSIERSEAINLILQHADIENMPDINTTLVVNDDDA